MMEYNRPYVLQNCDLLAIGEAEALNNSFLPVIQIQVGDQMDSYQDERPH